MILIRNEQMEAMARAREESFERVVAGRLREKFPGRCKELGNDTVRQSVHKAMLKGKEHGFETEECIFLYLDLMYVLGFDFDADPRLPWVRETLNDQALGIRTRLLLLLEQADAEKRGETKDAIPRVPGPP